ncbi:MAG: hydrogenase maturation nickel metallochaperone HypA [Chitinispirillaceae bacterium]|nr:hydrogenase maturation nickel metallochaperone HypA [Chitinispirillaceae bacterium]
MHELSIAEELINIINQTAKANKLSRVAKVKLRIGEMRGIVPESLVFAFEVIGKGSVAEGTAIDIVTIKTKALCNKCKKEFEVEDYNFICPVCGSMDVVVIEGKELIIDSLEGE